MAKKESTFFNMASTLLIVTLISSALLGFVYEKTKQPIAEAMLAKKISAIQAVVPAFTNNPIDEKYIISTSDGDMAAYPARKNENLVGTAIETWTQEGFGGNIKVIVGFLPNGTIYDTAVIEHKETPGLGDKIEKRKSDFSAQFRNKTLFDFAQSPMESSNKVNAVTAATTIRVIKDGGYVDAITAATISSRAYCDAVQRAYSAYINR